jgi:hypothetical protein
MDIRKTAMLLTLGAATFAAPFATQFAFAADGDGWAELRINLQQMADKEGMVTKKEFLDMMAKKFDAMDKEHHGMLSPDDIMRIFNNKTGS